MDQFNDYFISDFLTAPELEYLRNFIPHTRDEYLRHMQIVYNLKLATPFPLVVHLETTNRCNLQCRMCQHPSMHRKKIDIDPELAKKTIDECAETGHAWFLHFFFFGEPFLCKRTIEYMRYARSKGLKNLSVTTNFASISQQEIRELVELPLESIIVSFEGLNRNRYRMIRGADYFNIVKNNIEYLLQVRAERGQDRPWLTITYVRTDESNDEIADFMSRWQDKVNAIHISPQFDFLGRPKLSQKEGINLDRILSRNRDQRQPCRQLWLRLAVLSNGEIVPCSQNMEGELSLGNIRNISLAEAWTGDSLAELRRQHIQNRFPESCVCNRCIDWDWGGRVDKRPSIKK